MAVKLSGHVRESKTLIIKTESALEAGVWPNRAATMGTVVLILRAALAY